VYDTRKYRYSILQFQPSLHGASAPVPVAVVVLDEYMMVLLTRAPFTPEGISGVGISVLAELPRIVMRQLETVGRGEDPLKRLSDENRWNLFFTPAKEGETAKSIRDVAHELFGQPTGFFKELRVGQLATA
jgi:hypothetical protein